MAHYPALIHRDEGTSYGVSFPDFPGVIASGDTLEEAILDAEEALVTVLEVMHEDGTDIPDPTELERVADLDDARDAKAIVLVEARFAEPTIRVNTTLPASLVARIDREAERRGMSRSGFLAAGARAELRRAAG
ncbi:MAG: type II toxin-antitoxin system HicB family antitoxin [Deltaproteobacteria bacterium]|nr:type II toxin-antitoxin system HicB family antitoxin [Deltaproteobacteria bacterium]